MSTALKAASIALFLVVGSPPAEADESDLAPTGRGVVVWIASPGENVHFLREVAPPLIEELGITVIVEEAGESPSLTHALETLGVHHALAVVWHGEGQLQLLFAGAGIGERLKTRAGPPQEEALYVRDALAARLEQGEGLTSEILVTVPGEVLEPPTVPPGRQPRVGEVVILPRATRPRSGGRLGVGYFLRGHFDEVSWSQHCLTVLAPAWRFERGLMLRLMAIVGLPTSIGDQARDRLEVRSVGGVAGAAWIPIERRWFEVELGGGAGFEQTTAVAFLERGEAEGVEHLSGLLTAWLGLVWHPTPGADVRLHLNGIYVLRPPSYSINGKGDFGSFPWQPGAGVDIAVTLF